MRASSGATTVVFDGFAAYPKLTSPWDLMERERITHMGTSPRFFQACRSRVRPKETHDMAARRVIFSGDAGHGGPPRDVDAAVCSSMQRTPACGMKP